MPKISKGQYSFYLDTMFLIGMMNVRYVNGDAILRFEVDDEICGPRIHRRFRNALARLSGRAIANLANLIISRLGTLDQRRLRESGANIIFRNHASRGQRYQFDNAGLIASTAHPGTIVAVVEIGRQP